MVNLQKKIIFLYVRTNTPAENECARLKQNEYESNIFHGRNNSENIKLIDERNV